MQVLGVEQYDRLRQLARDYWRQHAGTFKRSPGRNPRLGVDALCFQPLPEQSSQGLIDGALVGALLTPISLSLAILPAVGQTFPGEGERWIVELPDGHYPFHAEAVGEGLWLWRCPLLDNLRDLESLQEASQLAQRLLDRVMTPTPRDPPS